jgi:hypothetical protein
LSGSSAALAVAAAAASAIMIAISMCMLVILSIIPRHCHVESHNCGDGQTNHTHESKMANEDQKLKTYTYYLRKL